MPRVIVIGGGIAGLSAAYRLAEASLPHLQIDLFEAGPHPGGVIRTVEQDGFLVELGPDAFLSTKPWLIDLCRRLGIADRLMPTNSRFRRSHIVFRGRLHPLPEGFLLMAPTRFWPLAVSPLFTWRGKCRMAMDLVLPAGSGTEDESLGAFVTRRLGREVLDRVVQPLVGGIYTGDPDTLSLKATLPRFLEMEAQHGSIIKAMWRQRRTAARRPKTGPSDSGVRYSELLSFDRGMQTIVDRLMDALPARTVHCRAEAVVLRRTDTDWRVTLAGGDTHAADGIILALPAHRAGALLKDLDPALSTELAAIPHASSAILNLAYRRADVPHPLDGFGFVVPVIEQRRIIACSFSSVKFPGRAPEDRVLLRAFVGGALQPHLLDMDDEAMERAVREELNALMGIDAPPLFTLLTRYPASMPQYQVGHLARVERIRTGIARHPGLALAGNAYHGVGLPDCVHAGETAAEQLLKNLPLPA
jgi:oxygen-dependent protoporphyrinogen oxidase